jgi:capsule polysaccharide export protein KpsE/RkpR
VLPPFEKGVNLPFMGQLDIDVFGANEISSQGLLTLLKSRNLKDRINKRMDLVKHYHTKDLDLAYKEFDNHLAIEIETQESIGQISVISFAIHILDRNPQFAVDLLHVVLEEWDKFTIELNQNTAGLRRQFVEQNLREKGMELAESQDSLIAFQERNGLASIDDQVSGTVNSAMQLGRQIAETRVAVQVMEQLFQPDYPELQRARIKLQELLKEEEKIRTTGGESGLLLPLGTAPEIGLQFARLYYRTKMLETMSGILAQQYEQARFQELKDLPALRIVDRGVLPIRKYKPKRFILVLIASMSAFFLALLAVYFMHYIESVQGTEEQQWVSEAGASLKADYHRIFMWRRNKPNSPS